MKARPALAAPLLVFAFTACGMEDDAALSNGDDQLTSSGPVIPPIVPRTPAIESFSPSHAHWPWRITVTGRNFDRSASGSLVWFRAWDVFLGNTLVSAHIQSPTTLYFDLPAGSSGGRISLRDNGVTFSESTTELAIDGTVRVHNSAQLPISEVTIAGVTASTLGSIMPGTETFYFAGPGTGSIVAMSVSGTNSSEFWVTRRVSVSVVSGSETYVDFARIGIGEILTQGANTKIYRASYRDSFNVSHTQTFTFTSGGAYTLRDDNTQIASGQITDQNVTWPSCQLDAPPQFPDAADRLPDSGPLPGTCTGTLSFRIPPYPDVMPLPYPFDQFTMWSPTPHALLTFVRQ